MVLVRRRSWRSFEVSPLRWAPTRRLDRVRTEPLGDDTMRTVPRSIVAAASVAVASLASVPGAAVSAQQPSQAGGSARGTGAGIVTTVSAAPFDSTLARLERAI